MNALQDENMICVSVPHGDRVIRSKLYGADAKHVVVLSNDASNDSGAWDLLIAARGSDYAFMTYDYDTKGHESDELLSVLSWLHDDHGAERVILLGASLGAAASIKAASSRQCPLIDALIALSPPLTQDGERLYSMADLRMITCPKLLIATEFEDDVDETREIFAELEDPRYTTLYPGDSSGTGIFKEHGDSLVMQLVEYIPWAFAR